MQASVFYGSTWHVGAKRFESEPGRHFAVLKLTSKEHEAEVSIFFDSLADLWDFGQELCTKAYDLEHEARQATKVEVNIP